MPLWSAVADDGMKVELEQHTRDNYWLDHATDDEILAKLEGFRVYGIRIEIEQ